MTNAKAQIRLSFEQKTRFVAIDKLRSLKKLRPGVKDSKKYQQILGSVRVIGLVEAPVIAPDPEAFGYYFLLDGHLRVEALKDIGAETVECLVSTDDKGYTYNKQINRLAAVQEHRMICRAIERGVPEAKIAQALGLELASVQRRSRMLNGICPEAIEILMDLPCPIILFDMLRQMRPARQLEAAELIVGQNNFSGVFAKALLAATPDELLVKARNKASAAGANVEQIARMERELARLQVQVKSVEDSYGVDNLHLTVARGYVRSLLGNARLVRWISQHRPEYLAELQAIAEVESIGLVPVAAE
jgi:hypothetical protein